MYQDNRSLYTASGRLIEFPERDKNFYKYSALKIMSLIIDYLIIYMPLIIIWMLYSKSILFISMIGLAWSIPYNSIMLFSFNATVGMLITRLRLGHASGFMVPNWVVFVRASLNSMYSIPFAGWVVMLANCFIAMIYKGWTTGDLLSKTSIFTKNTFVELNEIENSTKVDI